jgi:galactose mutarotase-like enzyme
MQTIAGAPPAAGHGTQEGCDTVMLSAGPLEAAFAPGLGMAGVSLRHEGDELLDRQAGLRAYARTARVRLHPAGQVFTPCGAPFICFEPMTAPTNALRSGAGLRRVRPGDVFTAVYSIHVS